MAEQASRTAVQRVQCMLHGSGLCVGRWAPAISAAMYLKNQMATKEKAPCEAWCGRDPALVHVLKVKGKNLDYQAVPAIFVGHSATTNQDVIYDPTAKLLTKTRAGCRTS